MWDKNFQKVTGESKVLTNFPCMLEGIGLTLNIGGVVFLFFVLVNLSNELYINLSLICGLNPTVLFSIGAVFG